MNVIADVTKSFEGTVAKVLEKVRRGAATPVASMSVLIYDDQQPELQMAGADMSGVEIRSISRTKSVQDVALEMALEAAAKFPSTVFFSFHANVLALAGRLSPEAGSRVQFCPWGKAQIYFNKIMPERVSQTMPTTHFGAPVSETEALAVLKAALEGKGATSRATAVQQTNLRPLMSSRDARFYKANPATNAPNYISSLLQRAQHAGLVGVESVANNPWIWLAAKPQLDLIDTGKATFGKVVEAAANAPGGAADVVAKTPLGKGTNTRPEEIYTAILRNHKMGPFANVRDDLYAALEKLSGQKMPLDRLITACITKAQEAHTAQKDSKIPWKTSIRNFLVKLLTRRPVLRDAEDNYVTPSFHTGQTAIHGVDPEFRNMLDGDLVMFLLEQGAEIKYEDRGSVVGALYMTRDSNFQDQLDDVFAYLKTAGLIQYVGGGIQLVLPAADNVTVMPQRKV